MTRRLSGIQGGTIRLALALALLLLLPRPGAAATSGANASHDPSRLIESDGRFYFCSTGGGCASSADGLAWTAAGLHIAVPPWAATATPGATQGVWAPDIVFHEGKFLIFYSFCSTGTVAQRTCAIGLYTTPTLDSKSPSYALTDAGLVVTDGGTGALFSTIDPGPIVDSAGNLWTTWGSGFGHDFSKTQLWLTRLVAAGLPLTSDSAYHPPAAPGHALQTGRKEGSYLYERQGSYYLFYNTGGCCAGTASTYEIWVARSTSITGPFTGDRIFLASHDDVNGPGHVGIYDDCGASRFTYHYYPTATSILGENDLSWTADGWPVAGAESTTPLKPCGSNRGAGGGAGTSGAAGAGGKTGAGGAAGAGGSGGNGAPGGGAGNQTADAGAGGMSATGGGSGRSGSGTGGNGIDAGSGGTHDPSGAAGSSGDRGGQAGGGNLEQSGGGCTCMAAAAPAVGARGRVAILTVIAFLFTSRRRRRAHARLPGVRAQPATSARTDT